MSKPRKKTQIADHSLAASLYFQALELPSENRRAFLLEQRRLHPELKNVLTWLADGKQPFSNFLANPPVRLMQQGPPTLERGEVIGDFQIQSPLGVGGFASVYLARQLSLDRVVALKVGANMPGQEAHILANLDHDNIVTVYAESVDPHRDLRLIAMQYIHGATLASVITGIQNRRSTPDGATLMELVRTLAPHSGREGDDNTDSITPLHKLDLQEATLWIGAQLAEALGYAHRMGVCHLDVKPSNIIINWDGRPFLTDFNVSIQPGALKAGLPVGGTPGYMAPEQVELFGSGDLALLSTISYPADIFSLGVVLKELLGCVATGRGGRHTRVLKWSPRGMEELAAAQWKGVDVGVRVVLNRCTAAHPQARFPSAASLARALNACLELRSILKRMAAPGLGISFVRKFPALSLSIAFMSPLLIATAASFAYSSVTVRRSFPWPGNVEAGGLGALFVALAVLSFFRFRRFDGGRWQRHRGLLDGRRAAETRESALTIGRWIFASATLLWLPFVLVALIGTGTWLALPPYYLGRMLVAASLLGLFGASYASLLCQGTALFALYPRFWLGELDIREVAAAELKRVSGSFRVPSVCIVLVPLLMAAIAAADPRWPSDWRTLTMAALVALSLAGVAVSASIGNRVNRFIAYFSGA